MGQADATAQARQLLTFGSELANLGHECLMSVAQTAEFQGAIIRAPAFGHTAHVVSHTVSDQIDRSFYALSGLVTIGHGQRKT